MARHGTIGAQEAAQAVSVKPAANEINKNKAKGIDSICRLCSRVGLRAIIY